MELSRWRITNRAARRVAKILLKYGLQVESVLGLPFLSARVIATNVRVRPGREKDWTVLCVERESFSKDIDSMEAWTDVHCARVPVSVVRRVLSPRVPSEMQEQTYFDFYDEARHRRARRATRRLFRELLRVLRKRQRIDAVLSSNVDYWQDGGFRLACTDEGIPFLVLLRELLGLPKNYESTRARYAKARFRFNGTAIAVFGSKAKDVLVHNSVCKPEHVWVTGAPRFDGWRKTRHSSISRDSVTLLSYRGPRYRGHDNFIEVIRSFVELAQQFPKMRFVVKCKREIEARVYCPQLLEASPSPNVQFVWDEALNELLPRSRAIVGFNSTAVLEGLLCDGDLIVPYWGTTRRPASELLVDPTDPLNRAVFAFPESVGEFRAALKLALETTRDRTKETRRRRIFENFFHFPSEATCSDEVVRFMRYYASKGSPDPDLEQASSAPAVDRARAVQDTDT